MTKTWAIGAIAIIFTIALAGCSNVADPKEELGYAPATKSVAEVRNETRAVASEVLNAINLNGKVTEPGPRISTCGALDADKFFVARHPWSLYGVPVGKMREAMERLNEELPRRDWSISSFGPNGSKANSLELRAESVEEKFSVQITLQDRRGRSEDPSLIEVSIVSACYEVPAGQSVDEY